MEMGELVECPEPDCHQTAEVNHVTWVNVYTSGGVLTKKLVRVMCVGGHFFRGLEDEMEPR